MIGYPDLLSLLISADLVCVSGKRFGVDTDPFVNVRLLRDAPN